MNYVVAWSKLAENQLANLWLASVDRKTLTAATNEIDGHLASDPLGIGESREGNNRIYFLAPLGVIYRVNTQKRLVTVLSIWQFKKKSQTD